MTTCIQNYIDSINIMAGPSQKRQKTSSDSEYSGGMRLGGEELDLMSGALQEQQQPSSDQDLFGNISTETNQVEPRKSSFPSTPPRRRSYLSPTKASLARSHPDVLAKSPKRGSLTEPRGRLLRQELLGIRKTPSNAVVITSSEAPTGPLHATKEPEGSKSTSDGSGMNGFSAAITQIHLSEEASTDKEQSHNATRSPLMARQPPSMSPRKRPRDDDGIPIPKLVKRSNRSTRLPSEPGDEPELPPTPVQLGISPAPERPKGLPSSSSRGSKSGSGRHRRRVRERGGAAVTSSPLKPKDTANIHPQRSSDEEHIYSQRVEEAPESDTEVGQETTLIQRHQNPPTTESRNTDKSPTELSNKQKALTDMKVELQRLQQQITQLESLTEEINYGKDIDIPANTLDILQSQSMTRTLNLQSPDLHPLFVKNPSAYLTLFAPGNLRLVHSTATKNVQERPKLIHILTVSPPSSWPENALQLALEITVDIDKARVDSITQSAPKFSRQSTNLHQWIEDRLEDPLHKHDICGIVWGAGQYFTACISRANILRSIEDKSQSRKKRDNNTSNQVSLLYPYLHKTRQIVASSSSTKRIMVTYEIELTWTGDATPKIDVTFSGITSKAQKSARVLFHKLLVSGEGVVSAFDRVCDLLEFH